MAKKIVSNKIGKIRWVTVTSLVGLLILFIPILITYSDNSTKFLDKKIVYAFDNLFAQIPAVPKTSRQVLVRALFVNAALNSYKIDAKITLGGEKLSLVEIETQGVAVNPGKPNNRSQTKSKGKIRSPLQVDFDFETYNSGKNLYFKVNQGIDLSLFNTNNLQGWYQLDLDRLEKDLKVEVKTESDIIKDVNQQIQSYIDTEIREKGIKKKEVSQDGKNYYQLETISKTDPLSQTFFPISSETNSKVTILVEKKSYFLHDLRLESAQKSQVGLRLTYQINSQNAAVNFEEPKDVKKINNPVELYLLFTSGAKPTADNLLKALGGEVKEVSTTLLTIERLTKVLLFLPKAI